MNNCLGAKIIEKKRQREKDEIGSLDFIRVIDHTSAVKFAEYG